MGGSNSVFMALELAIESSVPFMKPYNKFGTWLMTTWWLIRNMMWRMNSYCSLTGKKMQFVLCYWTCWKMGTECAWQAVCYFSVATEGPVHADTWSITCTFHVPYSFGPIDLCWSLPLTVHHSFLHPSLNHFSLYTPFSRYLFPSRICVLLVLYYFCKYWSLWMNCSSLWCCSFWDITSTTIFFPNNPTLFFLDWSFGKKCICLLWHSIKKTSSFQYVPAM